MLQPAAQADTQTGTTSRNLSSLEDTDAATASQADPTSGMPLTWLLGAVPGGWSGSWGKLVIRLQQLAGGLWGDGRSHPAWLRDEPYPGCCC